MPTVSQIIQMRTERRQYQRRNPNQRFGLGCSSLASLLVAVGFIALALAYAGLTRGLPSLEALPALLDPPGGLLLQPTRLYDRSGEYLLYSLENPAAQEKKPLALAGGSREQVIPDILVSATVAASDPTFWSNPGYSLAGLWEGSHPTLAQKLVSELLLTEEPSGIQRALRERLLAAQLTRQYGREQVLIWYLNSASYGRLAYGADAAARVYFDKPAADLTLAEAAMLAGVAGAPMLNPIDSPQAAVERQKQVLQAMQAQGLITAVQARQAGEASLGLNRPVEPPLNIAPAFTNLVLEQLETQFGRARLERGGLKVITSLDYNLQLQANCTVATQMARLEDPLAERPAADGSPCQAARLLPTLPVENTPAPSGLASAAVVLDTGAGEILAMVGDPETGRDPAHLPGQAPGSLVTPFIYLTAFTRGMSPASLVWDIPANPSAPEIRNFDDRYRGPMRLRMALANDYIVPAVQILGQIGAENVWRTARQLGLTTLDTPAGPGQLLTPLQGGEVTLLEITHAYGVFANQGTLVGQAMEPAPAENGVPPLKATAVLRVDDDHHQEWLDWSKPQTRPVISSQLAYLITHILSDESARWPSLGHPNSLEVGRPAAAKPGRTADGSNAWTLGYTPQLVVGVWVGRDSQSDNLPEGGEAGEDAPGDDLSGTVSISTPAAIWHAILQYSAQNLPVENWAVPSGITTVNVCDPSGLLPSARCPTVVSEVFLAGSEPTHTDTMYRAIQINRETSRLATVFTPAELVEERVFLIVPPEAVSWARQTGLPTPPQEYDVIPAQTPGSDHVRISSPGMYTFLSGEVPLIGSASGDEFAYYRLQFGQGLNPQEWLQIGQDMPSPVSDGPLGVWDTSGLNGLYVLKLLVMRQDKHVDTAVIQVSIDNQAPEVLSLYPAEGQELTYPQARIITLQARASDNLVIASVTFFIDGHKVATLSQPPFATPWESSLGSHTMRVEVVDQAGNTAEASTEFVISR